MTPPAHTTQAPERARGALPSSSGHAGASPHIAVVIVTWNRADEVRRSIESVRRQRGVDLAALHLVVVDNASTDGTSDALEAWLRPERIVSNDTPRADAPAFVATEHDAANTAGFGSATIVRNHRNLGGTGGFNTGFLAVERILETALRAAAAARNGHGAPQPAGIEYVWLLDDDAEADDGALASLLRTAAADSAAVLVGSRAVDIHDRESTFETTIYYDQRRGLMSDTPPPEHRLATAHDEWVREVGGTRGTRRFAGVREVDVVSACSMLVRWSAASAVGYWDSRYFIYCDDADWCLRIGRAGHRVVCNLDAVVYHTPWFHKLTPTRLYYSQRNAVWTMAKGLSGAAQRRSMLRWMGSILCDALAASFRRRLFHAEIIRRTAADIATNRGGKLDGLEPDREPVLAALDRASALRSNATVLALCMTGEQVRLAERLVTHATERLIAEDRPADQPRWIFMVRNDAEDPAAGTAVRAEARPERLIYAATTRSRLRRQWRLLRSPPAACVVFNQTNDVPLLRCPWTLHADGRDVSVVQAERDTLAARAGLWLRWLGTLAASLWFVARSPRQVPPPPFG
ncbi:MAG: glycosyltransferase [Planctomycetota bacterium]